MSTVHYYAVVGLPLVTGEITRRVTYTALISFLVAPPLDNIYP